MTSSPLFAPKEWHAPSLFQVEKLLREAKRQKGMAEGDIPLFCLLDPDGDILRYLRMTNRGTPSRHWACYHTELYECEWEGIRFGVVACAVGAPFAVLVAEEMFASGCKLLVSITSAGSLSPDPIAIPHMILEDALRDEGTSHHYAAPASLAFAKPVVLEKLKAKIPSGDIRATFGRSWTTDAPFRETESAISAARAQGALAVEMEASALYTLSQSKGYPIVCVAHLTNTPDTEGEDFEKGEHNGALDSLRLFSRIIQILTPDASQS